MTGYSVSAKEVASFIEAKLKEFQRNPLLNLNTLTHIGMVLTALGLVKNDNTLKMLGDLLTEAPDRLRPLISLRYTLVGTIGELQATLNKLAEDALKELTMIVHRVAEAIAREEKTREELAELTGLLYDLLVVRLPSVSIAAGVTEAE